MSLQKHLSTSYSKLTPQFHVSHFRRIVSFLLLCPLSTRPQQGKVPKSSTIDPKVLHHFHETWFSIHADIRWFFLRESVYALPPYKNHKLNIFRTILCSSSEPHVASNLLSILERLTTFPTEQSELRSWWVEEMEEMGNKPPKPKRSSNRESSDSEDDDPKDGEEGEDDWRRFFDESSATTDSKSKTPSARLHRLTIHQSLHSPLSHRAVFTRAWLALLPQLTKSPTKALVTRALNVMHRGVMPHLTRPVLVMDWVAGSVDAGLCSSIRS